MRFHRTLMLAGLTLPIAACSGEQTSPVAPEQLSADALAPLHSAAHGEKIEGSYIVVLKEGANPRSVMAVAGVEPTFGYDAETLNGFAAILNHGQLNALRNNPNVEFVEEDQTAVGGATQYGATWGIDRTDQRDLPLSGCYFYSRSGSGVYAYIIDTSIRTSHAEFGSRARNVYDAFGSNGRDYNGHGTHVAGTVGEAPTGWRRRCSFAACAC